MKRNALITVGAVLVVLGVIFGLQGVGVLGGSAMSGSSLWSVLGPLIAVLGLILVVLALRVGRSR